MGRVFAPLAILAPALAQVQFQELGKRHLPVDIDYTQAVACCDVDGDGDQDLVFGNTAASRGTGGQNRLYLNDGTGIFTDATASHMPMDSDQTRSVVCCDVDGDGDPDLVFGNGLGGVRRQNLLYLNDGTGAFTDATAQRMPPDADWTFAVACCDVDGDGDPDLVFGNGNGGQNRLYLNDGTGAFTDATAQRMPPDLVGTRAVACCDVDGDGDPDLVFGTSGQNRLYLNDGTGTFTDATASRMPIDGGSSAVACCDVDGDGDPDLVFATNLQNRLYLNDGTGTFMNAPDARMPMDAGSTLAVACCDVDGDGDFDLAFGNMTGNSLTNEQNRLYLNDGAGTFTDATVTHLPPDADGTLAAACCDVDGDGAPDLVFGTSGQNRLYLNDGTGTFTDATASRMATPFDATHAMACCDVDGDGDLDLVFGNASGWCFPCGGQNLLYLNDGTGTFTDTTATRMPFDGNATYAVVSCDVDGDGDPDLVFGNVWWGQNRLYLNDGNGNFTDATASRMPMDSDETVAVACCDVDGDGDPDLVSGNGGQNRLYLNDGAGTFSDATATRMPMDTDWTMAVACCDVDGDGDADLVFGNIPDNFGIGGQNRLYLNDGTGTFIDSRMPLGTIATRAVVCCDVDGDGDPDLVFGNHGRNQLFLNNGTGIFTDATATRMPMDGDWTMAVACCDFDGDGAPDLVIGNLMQQNGLYMNDGSGTFTAATATRMPMDLDYTSAVACCDVDGDGDADVIFGNGSEGSGQPNRLYLNLLRQLDAPFLLRVGHSYRLDAYARHGPASLVDVALPAVSCATARIPLPPLGTLGLDPACTVALPAFVIPQPAGVGSVSVVVPGDPSLVGAAVYAQALLVQYPVQDRLTNVTADVILR